MAVTWGERFADFAAMFFMGVFSLGLLAYVGYGEAANKYPQFEIEKVTAQARPVQFAIEKYLSTGIPLRQFAGFDTLTAPIVKVDPAIDALTVIDRNGAVVFENGQRGIAINKVIALDQNSSDVRVEVGAVYTQVFMPLRSRFGFGGQLIIHVPNDYVREQVKKATKFLPWSAAIGSLLLGLFGAIVAGKPTSWRTRWDKVIFIGMFVGVAATVVGGLASLYSAGAQSKAVALGGALTERVSTIYDMGLSLGDVEGLDRTFSEYRRSFPELRTVSMIIDDVVLIHTDPAAVGKALVPDRNSFSVFTEVDEIPGLNVKVYVSIPHEVVYLTVGRSAKTFGVLLVASGFMAGLFFQLGGALRRMRLSLVTDETDGRSAVDAIKPALFMGFFIENLAVSFLPQLMQSSAAASGLPPFMVSAMFMAYFVTFALTLVPAGIYAAKHGPTRLIFAGALLVAIAAAAIALSTHFFAPALRSRAGLAVHRLSIFHSGLCCRRQTHTKRWHHCLHIQRRHALGDGDRWADGRLCRLERRLLAGGGDGDLYRALYLAAGRPAKNDGARRDVGHAIAQGNPRCVQKRRLHLDHASGGDPGQGRADRRYHLCDASGALQS